MTDKLEELLENLPGDGASEDEVNAFMEKVMAEPGGLEAIKAMARQMTGGAAMEQVAEEDARAEKLTLKSPARLIFRVELLGIHPRIWRRISLPADCAFFHLHHAIQDAFGWEDRQGHRFEVWEDGRRELVFGPPGGEELDDDYCEVENRVLDLFREEVGEFRYLYDLGDEWWHRVVVEQFVGAGRAGTSEDLLPKLHDGAGHGPPEGCGGIAGFSDFLRGDHALCENYDPEILEEFREGRPDFPRVIFRDAARQSPG